MIPTRYECINCAARGCDDCDGGMVSVWRLVEQRWRFRKTRIRVEHRPYDLVIGVAWRAPDMNNVDRFWTWDLMLPFVRLRITRVVS